MHPKSRELRAQAAQKYREAKTLWDTFKGDKTDSADSLARYDALVKECDELKRQAEAHEEREQRLLQLETLASVEPTVRNDNPGFGMGATRESYSFVKVIRQLANGEPLDGVEGEFNQQMTRQLGVVKRGAWVPISLPSSRGEQRSLTASTAAGALETKNNVSDFIDILRNKMLLRQLGVKVLTDLNGAIKWPKKTATSQAFWVPAGSDIPTKSTPAIGQIGMNQKQIGTYTDFDVSLLNLTSMDVEAQVKDDLTSVLALEIDRAGFNGSGSGGQPLGIGQDPGVNIISLGANGGPIDWPALQLLEGAIDDANALDGQFHFVTTPKVRAKLKSTLIAANTAAQFIWDKENKVNGYQAWSTKQLPGNLTKGSGTNLNMALLFKPSDCMLGFFGAMRMTVNPYSLDLSNKIRVVLWNYVDFLMRYPEGAAKFADVSVA